MLVLCLLLVNVFAAPSQVHLSFPGDPTTMLVMWNSPAASGSVQYGTSPSGLSNQVAATSTSYSYQGYTSQSIWSAVMTGLTQGANMYYYRVGSHADGWSPVFSFKSAPSPGAPVSFGAVGDVGTDSDSNNTITGLLTLLSNYGIDMVVHDGDLSYANDFTPGGPVWDSYGAMLQPLLASIPYSPSVGNHEKADSFVAFSLRYNLPLLEQNSGGGNYYWSINYGNVHVILLSSETDYSVGGAQYNWLQNDLQNVNRGTQPWIIASWHTPWYNSNHAHNGEGAPMQDSFEPLFNKYNVNLGLSGHVHAYERTTAVYQNTVTPGATSYMTLGNGGVKVADNWLDQPPWSVQRISAWGYTLLEFLNSTHCHMRMFFSANGTVADEAWYTQ